MATIVQPYNPWREQLALTALGNIAGDIIGDMWKTHRQNEQNRKINAFRGELQNLAQQQKDNISLAQPQAPQGYNSNPWANALHQSYSPLTQFDIGTAGIGKTPSLQDIERNADTLAASKRFSMLSPETVQGVKNSMMQNAVASLFGNAADWGGKINAFGLGVANGVVPYQAMTALSQLYVHDNPHKQLVETDLGDNKRIDTFDPASGTITQGTAYRVGVSPNEAARNAASIQAANINANAHIFGSNSAAETARQRLEHDRYTQMMTDYDNQLKGINDDITAHLAVMDTLPNDEARAAYRLSKIAPLEEDKARIIAERNDAQARYRNALGFGTGAGQAGTGISRSDYDDIIAEASKTHGVDQDLIYAVAQIESGHKNGLTSNKGAQGVMQLMPDTAKRFGVTDVWNPKQNINAGVAYLKWLLDRYGGNEEKALQAYNCGEGRVARDGTKDKNTVPAVSVQYAKNVLAIANKRRAARRNSSQPQNTPNVTAVGNLQPQQLNTPQTTQQVKGSNSTTQNSQQTRQKSPVTAWVNEFDTSAYISTSDGNSYSKDEIEKLAQSQGLTLPQWLEKNNVQPFPALFPNTTAPRDPVAYMSNRYGNYFTQDEIQREAARKNLALEDYENQLREQGYRKADEDFPIENTQNEQDLAVSDWGLTQGSYTMPDSKRLPNTNPILDFLPKNDRNYPHLPFQNWPIGTAYNPQPSAFPDNYGDKNRRNSAPNINSDNQRSSYSPAWNFADFFNWINSYSNNENTFRPPAGLSARSHQYHIPSKLVDGNPFSNLIPYLPVTISPNVTALNSPPSSGNSSQIIPDFPFGADVIPQSVLFSDPFYFLKLKYGNNWR